jgi:calcineurin-like phosphoesterase family protein
MKVHKRDRLASLLTGAVAISALVTFGAPQSWASNTDENPVGTSSRLATSTTSDATVVAVAGDVACGTADPSYNGGNGDATHCRMKYTSDLVEKMNPATVFAMGDLQYNTGSLADFKVSYNNTWGRFKAKTHPVVGNHEYGTSGAAGYFDYFGAAAGGRTKGYYSFNVPVGSARWHVAVINSECARLNGGVGCAVGSPQYNWLKADLANNAGTKCTAVLSHKPRWSSSSYYTAEIQPLVDLMGAAKVDLLLSGHAHSYERFSQQTAAGQASTTGIRQITVGTGGRDSQGFGAAAPHSVVRRSGIFGVLKLTLHPTSYSWAFVPDPTTPFADSGSLKPCV